MINDLRQLLLVTPSIVALVQDRVFVDVAKTSSVLPRIVMHQMGSDEENDLEHSGDARTIMFDIDCEGGTGQDAFAVAEAVRLFLKDFSGAAGGAIIDAVIVNNEHSKVERTTQPGQVKQYAVTLDLDVMYRT